MLPRSCADLDPVRGRAGLDVDGLHCSEVLAREPERQGGGKGDWWWVCCRLSGLGLGQARRAIARAAHCATELVQAAGSRDRQGTVLQWFSLPIAAVELPQTLKGAGYKKKLKVVEVLRHRQPVTALSVVALDWRLHLRGAADSYAAGRAILDRLRTVGLPNYCGQTQLGPGSRYAKWGRLQLLGRPLPAAIARSAPPTGILLRGVQAQLFNSYLALRQERSRLDTLLAGDVVETGCNRPPGERDWALVEGDPGESQARMDSWEIVPLGPLYGQGCEPAAEEAGELEALGLREAGLESARLQKLHGGRRAIRVRPAQAQIDINGDDLVLDCRLPCEAQIDVLADEFIRRD